MRTISLLFRWKSGRRITSGSVLALGVLAGLMLSGCDGSAPTTNTTNNTGSSAGNNNNTGNTTPTKSEFAYVVNEDDSTVAQFTINADGTLAPLSPSTVPVTANAVQVVVTPNGQFAYVLAETPGTGAAVVSQFAVGANGTLKPLSPATVSLGSLLVSSNNIVGLSNNLQRPAQLTMDPQGRFLYAPASFQILRIAIGANGTLSASTAVASLTTPVQSFVLDPKGRFAYVGASTQSNGAFLAPFVVNADGSFTRIAGQDAALSGVTSIPGMAMDPAGKFLYTANLLPDDAQNNTLASLSQFIVNADGTVALVKTNMFTVPGSITSANFDSTVTSELLALFTFQPAFSPAGRFVYLPTGTPRVLEESVGADGTLTLLQPVFALAGSVSSAPTIDPSGAFLYVPNQDTSVSQFRLNADGALTPLAIPAVTTGHRPVSIATTVLTATKSARARER